jgi:hypothetical protein
MQGRWLGREADNCPTSQVFEQPPFAIALMVVRYHGIWRWAAEVAIRRQNGRLHSCAGGGQDCCAHPGDGGMNRS